MAQPTDRSTNQRAALPAPPSAARRPTSLLCQGETRIDDFHWLRERNNPEVIAYLEAENAYTAAAMAHTADLQERLFAEMRGRIQETDVSAPTPDGPYLYYERTEAGQSYPIYCRRAAGSEPVAAEQVLLDVNALAAGASFCAVGDWRVSPDHRLLAYAHNDSGDERFTIYVRDLTTGALLPDRIDGAYYGLEWADDSGTLFYTTMDAAHRPDKLWRHRLGEAATRNVPVFHEADGRFFLSLSKTRSGRFLLIHLESNSTSEVWFLPAGAPAAQPQCIEPRRSGHEYSVEHRNDDFLILSNDQAENFRVFAAPAADPGRSRWQEIVPHDPERLIENIDAFAGHLVLHTRSRGLRTIDVLRLDPAGSQVVGAHSIAFPEPVYTYRQARNAEFGVDRLRFVYSSLKTPPTVVSYGLEDRQWTVVKQDQIAGHNPDDYVTQRLWATAPDGTQVPISLVHRRGAPGGGVRPLLLYGYGAYGASTEPGFVPHRLSLLERGFVFAIAHVRGGSELGRRWYEQGKLQCKMNTFTDFIAAAEHLIDAGYTDPAHLVISGRSAGGLLMGAVTNLRPDLFAAVVAGVPFVDVLTTMLDPSIPLTVNEYEEWGNPEEPAAYAAMRAYSPYDNLAVREYPRLLITAGLNDPRVQYWEPAKYTARLRLVQTAARPPLLKTNLTAGHAGPSGRYDAMREAAFEYAFVIDAVAGDVW